MHDISWVSVAKFFFIYILILAILLAIRTVLKSMKREIRILLDVTGIALVIRVVNKFVSVLFAVFAIIGYFIAEKTHILNLIKKLRLERYTWFWIKNGSANINLRYFKPHIAFYYDEEDGITLEEIQIGFLGVGGGVYMPKILRRKVWRYIEPCGVCGKKHL